MDIAELGYSVDSSQLQKATKDLDQNAQAAGRVQTATQKLQKDTDRLALSQKQLAAAQRQLPMQFTDIFTGLATGQKPMMVLLQQGGQLKDVFGGIGPALRASFGYIAGLINPVTVLLGAVGALALAWKQNQEQLDQFNLSLARTNNFVGKNASQLQEMARRIDRSSEVTIGGATEAVNRLVAGGRVAGEQLEQAATATARWAAVSGDSIDDVAKKFEKLAEDPLKALLELTKAEHFLTIEQAERIKRLQEEGRAQDAVAESVRIYTDHLTNATSQARGDLGALAKLWGTVKDQTAGAWAEVQTYTGLLDNMIKKISGGTDLSSFVGGFMYSNASRVALRRLNQFGGGKYGSPAAPPQVQWQGIYGEADAKAFEKEMEERKKQEREWGQLTISNLSKAEKLEAEIAKIRKTGLALKKPEAEIEKAIADARARYAESLPKGSKATDPTDSIIDRLRTQIALNEEQAQSEERLTATERQLLAIQIELDRLGAKATPQRRAEIAQLMEKARATDAAAVAAMKAQKAEEALARLREQTALAEQNQRRSNEIDLMGISRGAEATEMLRRQLSIHRWYEDQVADLRRQAARERREVTAAEEQELKASLERQLERERQYQEQRKQLMGDWASGASRAFEDYLFQANDVASQTYQIFSDAFYGLENVMVDFLHKGSADWKGFLDDINRQILQFIVRQQLSKWMESLMGSGGGGGAGGGWQGMVGSFLGALFGGGRASGGDVRGDRVYRVGEGDQPELLNLGRGRQYMIPGDAGRVEPIRGGGNSRPNVTVPQTIIVQGRPDRRTAARIAQETVVKGRTALVRNGGGA